MKKTPATSKKFSKKMRATMPLHSDEDVKRYIGFLNEVHGDNLAALGEGVIGINERLDRIDDRLDGIDKRFDGIDKRLDGMDKRFDSVDERLDEHSELLGRLIVDVEDVKSSLRLKVDRDEYTKLEKRIVALESYVFTSKTRTQPK